MNLSPARWAREVCSLKVFTGISRGCLGELVVELAPKWVDARDSDRERSRGHERVRAEVAGRPYRNVGINVRLFPPEASTPGTSEDVCP